MSDFKQTIFLTGGAGFIGSNYLNKYVPNQPTCLFVNVDALTYAGKLNNILVSNHPNYRFEQIDIRKEESLRQVFKSYKPTAVLHFAAESHVDLSLKNPSVFFQTNVIGTNNLLNLSREFNVGRFHLVSTDEVYGALDSNDGSFSESSPINPRNPYSASKAAGDAMVQAYHHTFAMNTVITRSSNTYGPNQDTTKLIPRFIAKLQNDESVPLFGKGKQMREWTYVEDCIDGIHAAFTHGKSGEVYNIGSGFEISNYELTMKLLKEFNKDDSYISYVEDRLGHDFRYSLDISKIRSELDWSPKVVFEEGLRRTIFSYIS